MDNTPIEPHYDTTNKGLSLLGRIRKDPLTFFTQLGTTKGSYAWLSLMGSPVLFLNDAVAIEHVFRGDPKLYHKGKYNDGVRPLLGQGVFLAEEDLWNRQRRDIASVFSGSNFTEFTSDVAAAADEMMVRWEKYAHSDQDIDIHYEMLCFALDVVLRTLYHETSAKTTKEISASLGTMLKLAESRIWSVLPLPMPIAVRLPKYAKTLQVLDEIAAGFIAARQKSQGYPKDLLSRLVDCYSGSQEDQRLLRDNVMSFLLAGHETTANGITWAFYELGRHPNMRQRVLEEAERVLVGETVTYDQVKQLSFTSQVVSETLRLYPPVWTMSRQMVGDDIIPLEDGRTLRAPKGSTIMLCAYSIHRRERYWDDPESFLPERFRPGQEKTRPRYSWIPFGGGPRLCIGFKLAELESILVLAKAFKKFDLRLVPGQAVKQEPIITLRPDRPVMYRIRLREQNLNTAEASCELEAPPVVNKPSGNCPFHRPKPASDSYHHGNVHDA